MNFTMNNNLKDTPNYNNYRLTAIAMQEYNTLEFDGSKNNPEVVKYSKEFGGNGTDSMPWCSAFMNWCAKQAGLERTYKLNARSWLNVGTPIDEDDLQMGDVVVLWRGSRNGWRGHCGLFMREDEDFYWLLGGNQSNSVNISKYRKNRLLGVRRLRSILQNDDKIIS